METDYWNKVHYTSNTQESKKPVNKTRISVLLACNEDGEQTPLYIKLSSGSKYRIDEVENIILIYSRRRRYIVKIQGRIVTLYNDDKIWSIDANVFEELKNKV